MGEGNQETSQSGLTLQGGGPRPRLGGAACPRGTLSAASVLGRVLLAVSSVEASPGLRPAGLREEDPESAWSPGGRDCGGDRAGPLARGLP